MSTSLLCQICEWIGVPIREETAAKALARVPGDCNTRGNAATLAWTDLPDGDSKDKLGEMAIRYGYAAA
jgi:hypothetical protein